MDMLYVWLVLIALIGAFLQAAIGFGYAVFVMVFFPLILPNIPQAATVCSLTSLLISSAMLLANRKAVQPKKMLWPIVAYFICMPLALALVSHIPQREMSIGLGVFLFALGLYYLFSGDRLRIPSSPAAGMAVGSVTGLLGGLFAVSGPPAALYTLSVSDTKQAYIANLQFFFFITNVYSIPVRAMNGLVTLEVLFWSLFAAAGLFLGLFLGSVVCRKADLSSIKRWVFIFICAMGLWLAASNLF